MKVVDTPDQVRERGDGVMVLVPTMGALHEGHLSVAAEARRRGDVVVMSLFVNPLQFDSHDDLERYPRNLDRDTVLAAEAGVDILYAPTVETMYPTDPLTSVLVAGLSDSMEGVHRPGHLSGVATVVAKLFASLQPHIALFGRKDHQQLIVIRRLAHDLSFPVQVFGSPTVREPGGLALSSRNVLLDDEEKAGSISRGLFAAAAAVDAGERGGDLLERLVRDVLDLDEVDYVTLASQSHSEPIERLDRPAFLAVAATVGSVRLIDNLPIDLVGEMFVPDLGIALDHPSTLIRR